MAHVNDHAHTYGKCVRCGTEFTNRQSSNLCFRCFITTANAGLECQDCQTKDARIKELEDWRGRAVDVLVNAESENDMAVFKERNITKIVLLLNEWEKAEGSGK